MSNRSTIDGIMYEVCQSRQQLSIVFTLSMVGIVLMLLWVPFVDPNSGTGAIVYLNIMISSSFALFTGFFVWRCRVRSRE